MDFAEHFKAVNIGEPASAGGLRVFPLYPVGAPALSIKLLADAVSHGGASIAEDQNSDGPWFRKVVIENRGKVAVLVRDGDLLLGGMQDRTAERTCVVPAQTKVVVPALCVEQRRSHYSGREDFGVSRTSADPELRSTRISASVRRQSLQELTWNMVGTRRQSAGIKDGSGSLLEVEERDSTRLAEIEAALPATYLASGVAIAWAGKGGKVSIHVEIFADAAACAAAWPGLIRAAAQAIRGAAKAPRLSRTELRKLFRDASRAAFEEAPEVGVGKLHRGEFGAGVATLLSIEDRLVHASLFAA